MLTARDRIGVDIEQGQDAGSRYLYSLAVQVHVVDQLRTGRVEAAQDRDRQAGVAARRVYRKIRVLPELGYAFACLVPLPDTLFPERSLGGRVFVDRLALVRRRTRVHPGLEVLRPKLREGEQQVAHVALGVDRDHGNMIESCLLEYADTEPRFAGTGHADDHGMGCQVLGVIEDKLVRELVSVVVIALAEIESAELLEVVHLRSAHQG